MTGAPQTAGVRPPAKTLAGLILIIAGVITALAFIDSALERAEQRDIETQARHTHAQAIQLQKEGRTKEAIEFFLKAYAMERSNSVYQLDLIDELVAAKKTEEASPLIHEILLREPDDGRANLSAARWMLQKGKRADAISYYHRAVYGDWPDDAPAHRVAVRVELIHVLVDEGRKRELLAELLNLQVEAGTNKSIQKTLGHLFLVAGAPSRSAAAYQSTIQHEPGDAEAHAGLGEAELQRGEYHNAHNAFLAALHLKPQDASIQRRLDLSNTLTQLDPTPRRLASMEKYRRSMRILQLAYDDLNGCLGKRPGPAELLSAAHDALTGKPPSQAANELSESVLGLAEKLWHARIEACGASMTAEEEPLRLTMEKLAQ